MKHIQIDRLDEARLVELKKVMEKWFSDSNSITSLDYLKAIDTLNSIKLIPGMFCERCGNLSLFESGLCPECLLKNIAYMATLRADIPVKNPNEIVDNLSALLHQLG